MNLTRRPDETLYSIAQVNALTGVAKPTIRFWEKEFASFLHPRRTDGNQRRYSRSDIDMIERINHLVRSDGYTLEGARRKLELEKSGQTVEHAEEENMVKLADTMSDYLLKKLLAKSTT